MRLAACALSAVLLSGCSWLGMGGQQNHGAYGSAGGAYGVNCGPTQQGHYHTVYHQGYDANCAGFGQAGYGQAGYANTGYGQAGYGQVGAGQFAGVAGYGPAGAGYGQAAYGQAGYGAPVGAGLAAQGIGGGTYVSGANYGTGVTTLGAAAPYGGAYGQNVVGTQLSNGQYVNGQYVQNIPGAPIYVPQPYGVASYGGGFAGGPGAAPCGPGMVPCGTQLRGGSAAMPLGFEVFGGTEFDVSGDIFGGKEAGPNNEDLALATAEIGELDAISYADAFKEGVNFGGGLTYDLNRNTTLLAMAGYSKKEGQSFENGTFTPGTYDPATGAFTATGPAEDVTASFSDLEQYSIEGGVRQYLGHNYAFRPYVGATGGFTYNDEVTLTQTSSGGSLTADANTQQYVDSGWRPTAAGIVGAEMAVGPRAAIGIESGIRWRDNLKTNVDSDDRISIPVKLRGRVSF